MERGGDGLAYRTVPWYQRTDGHGSTVGALHCCPAPAYRTVFQYQPADEHDRYAWTEECRGCATADSALEGQFGGGTDNGVSQYQGSDKYLGDCSTGYWRGSLVAVKTTVFPSTRVLTSTWGCAPQGTGGAAWWQ